MKVQFAKRPEGSETMSPSLKEASRYYQWIVSRLQPYLGQSVLDIGGGFGAHLEHILPICDNVTSIDLSQSAVKLMEEKFKSYPNFRSIKIDFGADDEANRQLLAHQFDTVTALDVIEHIEDDDASIRHIHSVLSNTKGVFFMKVPAHQWLYGSLDHQAGHYRRYNKTMVRELLQENGFEILELFYFNVFGVLPWYINAVLLQQDIAAEGVGTQIKIFNQLIVPIMQPIEKLLAPPIGQSVIAVARAI